MKPQAAGAARRYARALLEVALEAGDPASLQSELRTAAQTLEAHSDLHKALAHPAIAVDQKKKIVAAVFKGAPDLLARLLGLLIDRDRLELLPQIAATFDALWNAHRGVVAAHAVTVTPLGKQQHEALASALGRATGRAVDLRSVVDPEILGGVRVELGGRIFDGTVKGRLRTLRHKLVEGEAL